MARSKRALVCLFASWSISTLLCVIAVLSANLPTVPTVGAVHVGDIMNPTYNGQWLDSPYVPATNAYKVQLHCHTSNSDGADTAIVVQSSYRDFGYAALAVTDHDYLTPDPGSGIIHIKGVEETSSTGRHILHINASKNLPSMGDQATIDSIISLGGLAFLCHPNFRGDHWPIEVMMSLERYTGIEIYNALVAPNQNAEAKWDQLLTSGHRVLGIAVDDAHTRADRNKAWVVVYCNGSGSAALLHSLRTGNFIATQGPNVTVRVDGLTITATTDSPSLIEFVKMNGVVACSVSAATSATYAVRGDELYVRIRVTRESDGRKAWTNPIWENIQTWVVKWIFDVRPIAHAGFAWSNILLADLDCDGSQEVLVGTQKGGRMLAVSPAGKLLWTFPPPDSDVLPQHMSKVQSVDDIDGDGKPEILISRGAPPVGQLVCLNWDGTVKWVLGDLEADFRDRSVIARDLDHDNGKEVVASANEGRIFVATNQGRLIWSKALPPGRCIEGVPNVFDVDRDGDLEILVFSGASGNQTGVLYCLDRWGNEKWTWSPAWCDGMESQPTIGDVNGDGEYEIVLGLRALGTEGRGGVVVLSFYGVELARKHLSAGVGQIPMLADIDEDGMMDILVGADDGFYRCFGGRLEEKWAFDIRTIIGAGAKPFNMGGALGDITGDGKIDVMIQSCGNCTLLVLDGSGRLAAEPYGTKGESTGSVAAGDIDNDGASDVVLFDGPTLRCLTLGGNYRAETFVWPMYGRDSMNTGAVPIPEVPAALVGTFILLAMASCTERFLSQPHDRARR